MWCNTHHTINQFLRAFSFILSCPGPKLEEYKEEDEWKLLVLALIAVLARRCIELGSEAIVFGSVLCSLLLECF